MIPLRARSLAFHLAGVDADRAVLRVSATSDRPAPLKAGEALIVGSEAVPSDFAWYILASEADLDRVPADARVVVAPDQVSYLGEGDVIAIDPARKAVRVLHRKSSPYNHFLLTERCNNYCLMCSQPPRDVYDTWVADEVLETLPLVSRDAKEIGFTGGEPTLLGPKFIELIKLAKSHLPRTALHILSNGRSFSQGELAAQVASIKHHDLMIGIPLYSDLAHRHDHVVQADGAYDETIRGILALSACGVRVEIRVVLQAQTVDRLPELARFISRNLLFVDHVALMGLEPIGFARANLQQIWADPIDYADQLADAIRILTDAGLRTSIYNSQLCVLPKALWPFARKSISDWKNEFIPECDGCAAKHLCPGFFSSVRYAKSRAINPILEVSELN